MLGWRIVSSADASDWDMGCVADVSRAKVCEGSHWTDSHDSGGPGTYVFVHASLEGHTWVGGWTCVVTSQ